MPDKMTGCERGSVFSDASAAVPPSFVEGRNVEVTCVRCPMGCIVSVEVRADGIAAYLDGAMCARGSEYAVAEATAPMRSVATTVAVSGCGEPLSVKTAAPIPRELVKAAVRAMKGIDVTLPVRVGEVVMMDVCSTGIPVIATKSIP